MSTYYYSGMFNISESWMDTSSTSPNFLGVAGNTIRLTDWRTISTTADTGYSGEICYNGTALHLHDGTKWRSLRFDSNFLQRNVIGIVLTTNSSGNATVDLSGYGFTSTPVVQLTPVRSSLSALCSLFITSVSTTSLSIHTKESLLPISIDVHITLTRQ